MKAGPGWISYLRMYNFVFSTLPSVLMTPVFFLFFFPVDLKPAFLTARFFCRCPVLQAGLVVVKTVSAIQGRNGDTINRATSKKPPGQTQNAVAQQHIIRSETVDNGS